MVRKIHRHWVWLLAVLWLASGLAAQTPYAIAYCDYLDPRSKTDGMAQGMKSLKGIRAQEFDLARPASLNAAQFNMVVISSYAEFHPNWAQFVRAKKAEISRFVAAGGVFVRMTRFRKAQGENLLLPIPNRPKQGSTDMNVFYAMVAGHDFWRGYISGGSRGGWGSIRGSDINGRKLLEDAFDKWDRPWQKIASTQKNVSRHGQAAALAAEFGKGEVLCFQILLDKINGIDGRRMRGEAFGFFEALLRYGSKVRPWRPIRKAAPRPSPPPRDDSGKSKNPPDDKTKDEDKNKDDRSVELDSGPPKTFRLRGRVFVDVNANGRFDPGEPPVAGARIVDGLQATQSDNGGRYAVSVSNFRTRCVFLEIPTGFRLNADWYSVLQSGAIKTPNADRDFPLQAIRSKQGGSSEVLIMDLSTWPNTGPSATAQDKMKLVREICDKRQPELILLRVPGNASQLESWRKNLAFMQSQYAFEFAWRIFPAQKLPRNSQVPFGPSQFALHLAGHRVLCVNRDAQDLAAKNAIIRELKVKAQVPERSLIVDFSASRLRDLRSQLVKWPNLISADKELLAQETRLGSKRNWHGLASAKEEGRSGGTVQFLSLILNTNKVMMPQVLMWPEPDLSEKDADWPSHPLIRGSLDRALKN